MFSDSGLYLDRISHIKKTFFKFIENHTWEKLKVPPKGSQNHAGNNRHRGHLPSFMPMMNNNGMSGQNLFYVPVNMGGQNGGFMPVMLPQQPTPTNIYGRENRNERAKHKTEKMCNLFVNAF
jgi:hypothetical protein